MEKRAIHFVGIKGVGMTPLAIIAKEAGFIVTGSDLGETFITDYALEKAGIVPFVGFSKKHISNPYLVITTGAHRGFENIEVKTAREKGIAVLTKGQAVGLFMDGGIFGRKFTGISIAGSHGKTTTTAMLATVLSINKLDPSYLVGTGSIYPLGLPGHYGKGDFFIAEADEYATEPRFDSTPQFLWQHPRFAIFTNIELDHPDIYPKMEDVRDAFLSFANQGGKDFILVACGDDPQIQQLLSEYEGKRITYGFSSLNDFVLNRVYSSTDGTIFRLATKGVDIGEFSISIPGEHNALNASGVVALCLELGLNYPQIKNGLSEFRGSKRRMEFVKRLKSGALVFDDYAHHPTEIKKTLSTFRRIYPNKKIICIFQPHTYSRTKKLFGQFLNSFLDADIVILTNIFPSSREKEDKTISSEILVDRMKSIHPNVLFLPELLDVVEYIGKQRFSGDSLIITMGAGDVYKISEELE